MGGIPLSSNHRPPPLMYISCTYSPYPYCCSVVFTYANFDRPTKKEQAHTQCIHTTPAQHWTKGFQGGVCVCVFGHDQVGETLKVDQIDPPLRRLHSLTLGLGIVAGTSSLKLLHCAPSYRGCHYSVKLSAEGNRKSLFTATPFPANVST